MAIEFYWVPKLIQFSLNKKAVLKIYLELNCVILIQSKDRPHLAWSVTCKQNSFRHLYQDQTPKFSKTLSYKFKKINGFKVLK